MTYDTLQYGSVEKSFADWGFDLDSVQDQITNQGNDVFTATIAGANILSETGSPTFPFESQITVRINRSFGSGSYSGGSVAFTGKRVENPAQATGSRMGVTYKFHGPWYDLGNTHYLQSFKGASSTPYLAAETVLNTSTALSSGQISISLGDQIQAILQSLLDAYTAQGLALPFNYIGRQLNTSTNAIDLTATSTTGTPGGDYNIAGFKYQWLIQSGTTIDRSLFNVFLPSYITKPLMCADALRKCLELSPRVCVWFDYTQSPPLVHFTAIDSATAQSLALFDGSNHKSLNIQARNDLALNSVRILYRITSTVSGQSVVDYAMDKWGPHGSNSSSDPDVGLRVVNELIDLQGSNTNYVKGHLDLELLACRGGSQATKRFWWASKRGGEMAKFEDYRIRFQDKSGTTTTIPDAQLFYASSGFDSTGAAVTAGQQFTTADYAYYQYRVVRGSYQPWMSQSGQPINTVKCKVVASMTFATYDNVGSGDGDKTGNNPTRVNNAEQHVNLELTNAVPDVGTSGYATFETVSSAASGETYIIGTGGIAQYLYNQASVLQYEGEFAKVEAAFGTGVSLGQPVNFTGGATAWTTMKAQVQEVRRHYGRHETSVRIGVAKHLNSGQLISLLNMWRYRRPWYNPALRTNNALGSGNVVDMAKSTGNANSTEGVQNSQALTLANYSTAPSGTTPGTISAALTLDPNIVGIIAASN